MLKSFLKKKNNSENKSKTKLAGEKSSKRDKILKRTRKEVTLPKDEYAQVMHELNTNLSKEERKKKQIIRFIGNNIYRIENNGFNNYKITGKYEIDT